MAFSPLGLGGENFSSPQTCKAPEVLLDGERVDFPEALKKIRVPGLRHLSFLWKRSALWKFGREILIDVELRPHDRGSKVDSLAFDLVLVFM